MADEYVLCEIFTTTMDVVQPCRSCRGRLYDEHIAAAVKAEREALADAAYVAGLKLMEAGDDAGAVALRDFSAAIRARREGQDQ